MALISVKIAIGQRLATNKKRPTEVGVLIFYKGLFINRGLSRAQVFRRVQ